MPAALKDGKEPERGFVGANKMWWPTGNWDMEKLTVVEVIHLPGNDIKIINSFTEHIMQN